jgi:hypothetical protein
MPKLLISIPVHESPDVVEDQVANVLAMNPESLVVLHVSREFRSRRFGPPVEFASSERVLINPTCSSTKSQGLLGMHLSNYLYAATRCQFDSFAINASNDMYVRSGAEGYAVSFDAIARPVPIPEDSSWSHARAVRNHDYLRRLTSYLKIDSVRASTPEGTAYGAELMRDMADILTRVLPYERASTAYPDEETVLPTIAASLTQDIGLPFVYSEVTTGVTLTPSLVEDVRAGRVEVPAKSFYGSPQQYSAYDVSNLYAVKRVPRIINDPLREYIRGLSR